MKKEIINTLKDLLSFKTYKENTSEFEKLFTYIKDKYSSLLITEYTFNSNIALVLSNTNSKDLDLLFCTHIDVVYADNYNYTEDDTCIYGRGTIDMKGSVAVLLTLMNNLKSNSKIALMITSDEEITGYCADELSKIYKSKFVIIPDGGTNFELITEEKGLIQLELTTTTKEAHSAQLFNGENAIVKLYNVYNKIIEKYPIPKNENEYITSVNLSKLNGGSSNNQVPGNASMFLDIRYIGADNKDDIINYIKNIDPEVVYEAMELALTSAYKKNFNSKTNVKVLFDHNTGEIKVYSYLTVVPDDKMTKEEYEDYLFEHYTDEDDEEDTEEGTEAEPAYEYFNKETEIKLSDAKKIDKTLEIGDTIDKEVTPKDFGRVAASTAKQVVVQKIREAERNSVMEEFGDKQDEMLIGTVALEDTDNYFIDLGRTNGILPKKDIIPGEKIEMGSQLKVYVSKVDNTGKNLLILLSRTHYGFVKRLFELEIPEITDGTVLIYSVARDPGNRSKVAVYSEKSNVDPIGACIGEKGSRIARIIEELHGEKLDVVKYDSNPAVFIANALSPAKDLTVAITDPKKQEAMVIADGDNFSLAIGKKGQNARLASKLTHYKIDIKTTEQAREAGINFR